MKKRIILKVKVLRREAYRKLARILMLRLGLSLDSKRAIFKALEDNCKKIDREFSWELAEIPFEGGYDPLTHTVYIPAQTFDEAWSGNVNALFTIVHEISHWALITVFKIDPKHIIFELPLLFSSTTDAELYADTFSCYLMMPQLITAGRRKFRSFVRKALASGKNNGIVRMSLVILKNRRYYNAVGYTTQPQLIRKAA